MTVNINELLDYYERAVKRDREASARLPQSLRERADYDQGYFHHRVLLKLMRERAGIDVCYGAVDCAVSPATHCKIGEHTTCVAHRETCYLCRPVP